mmetsp:Transcript_5376/g.9274  ORF Transcript_5376/g.9274 Transcript_5376/m.9274 type:complete len:197 (-) Transcript_5376:1324-1914(-)|eukprot:CAMPEP_0119102232 /NCGR_PEP_ID=MMETSP1180-20130426/1047_1 /TAXON_ID=3052 ORGANISM="Chlamydomonas cf sp, Strain CCMP681" /NCGR_SAMPLE_ID=MMETSP1180 /ASSEMBLY_ACC=CAM_ASM_000741 /LENGTH=196 /DNA_ID=CAMNT_0007086479 /DNA_START=78 /DNA_END=668 /DNA_ORIENTATION=+
MARPGSIELLKAELECEAFHRLEQLVASPTFLETLERVEKKPQPAGSEGSSSSSAQHSPLVHNPLDTEQTEILTGSPQLGEVTEADLLNPDSSDGWSMVDKDDAIDALAYYLAGVLMRHPEAQALSPKQLQEALTTALKTLKQSRFKQMWNVGRYAYRWTTLTWSAVQMYQNPWLIQAVLATLWTFSRLTLRTGLV